MKRCPFCAEEIQDQAVKCRFCGEFLDGRPRGVTGGGWEYRSRASIGRWPLVHIAQGMDPETGRPRIARGVIAVGNVAVGAVAVGGVAIGGLAMAPHTISAAGVDPVLLEKLHQWWAAAQELLGLEGPSTGSAGEAARP